MLRRDFLRLFALLRPEVLVKQTLHAAVLDAARLAYRPYYLSKNGVIRFDWED